MAAPPRAGEEPQGWEEEEEEEGTRGRSSPRAPHLDPREVQGRIRDRLRRTGRHDQALADPSFQRRLSRHLHRLPPRYLADLDADDMAEDVLLHWRVLDECADPGKRPVFHARHVKSITVRGDYDGSSQELDAPRRRLMEDLSLGRRKAVNGIESMPVSSWGNFKILLHEIIFCSIDKPKLLSQLAALLDEVGLIICEGHLYCTADGFCLAIFLVDGWETEETDGLIAKIKETIALKFV